MTCEQARDLLPLLYYDELDADERSELEQHVASCSQCRHECEGIRELLDRVDPSPEIDPGPDYSADPVFSDP